MNEKVVITRHKALVEDPRFLRNKTVIGYVPLPLASYARRILYFPIAAEHSQDLSVEQVRAALRSPRVYVVEAKRNLAMLAVDDSSDKPLFPDRAAAYGARMVELRGGSRWEFPDGSALVVGPYGSWDFGFPTRCLCPASQGRHLDGCK
jgi:hypothetical protein